MMPEYKDIVLIMQEIEQGKHNLKFKNVEYAEVFSSALAFFQGVIDRVPNADVVEVVRCKDCKYYNKDYHRCNLHSEEPDQISTGFIFEMQEDDFCSYGERKNGEIND